MFQLPEVDISLVLAWFVGLLLPVQVRDGFEVFFGVAGGYDFFPRAEQQRCHEIALYAEGKHLYIGVEVGSDFGCRERG